MQPLFLHILGYHFPLILWTSYESRPQADGVEKRTDATRKCHFSRVLGLRRRERDLSVRKRAYFGDNKWQTIKERALLRCLHSRMSTHSIDLSSSDVILSLSDLVSYEYFRG